MAKQEELGRTAPEQMKAFTRAVSTAEGLPRQREESLKKVLTAEIEIADKRKEALEDYFDLYTRKLESIKTTNESLLDDTFSVLNKKLTERYTTLSSEVTQLSKQLKDISNSTEEQAGSRTTSNRKTRQQDSKATSSLDRSTVQTLQQFAKAWNSFQSNPSSITKYNTNDTPSSAAGGAGSGGGKNTGNGNGGRYIPRPEPYQPAEQIVPDEVLSELELPNIDDVTSTLDKWRDFFKQTEEERRNAILEGTELLNFGQSRIQEAYAEKHKSILKSQAEQIETIQDYIINLEVARMEQEAGLVDQITQVRLDSQQKALTAELSAINALNNVEATLLASKNYADELGENRARESAAKDTLAEAKKREDQIAKYAAQRELYYKQKNGGVLSKEDAARVQKELAAKFKDQKKNEENLSKERERLTKIEYQKSLADNRKELQAGVSALMANGASLEERKQALYSLTHDDNGNFDRDKALSAAVTAISDLAKQLDSKIDSIAAYKGAIDTRLQGSNNKTTLFGSYWDQLTKDMMSVGAVTPFFKQEDFANNIKALVDRGISFDLKQRAFLMTIQEKIATTFDVADGTLLRLIRLQQEDSTAGRLGMESALNTFLNEMYENTEYLKDVASSVRSSLQEMEALMSGAEATEVEYQVQKWMGSLYSVGMSQEAVQSIASALGQIAAGQVDALTGGSGAGNLMVMAANEAGLTISDILTNGLDAKETNKLLQATVNYLAELAESSKDNKVVQQQLANVFGVKASDLRAATNLATAGSTADIYKESLTYDNMLDQLYKMANSMGSRTSIGEMMSNVWSNGQYTLASSMSNNPIAYLTYKMASLLDSTVGGIAIPAISVMGYMVDLETTVADLMRVAAVGTGILGNIGPMISGLSSSFSGQAMLSKMGISSGSGLAITPRGGDNAVGGGGMVGGGAKTTSSSGYVGNASGSDIKNSTIQEAEDSKKQQMIEAKEEAETTQIDFINNNVLKIYELLDEVASGKRSLNVRVSSYGLTSSGGSGSGGAQGGVAGLLSNTAASNYTNALSSGFSNGDASAGNVNATTNSTYGSNFGNTGVNLGGWTIN